MLVKAEAKAGWLGSITERKPTRPPTFKEENSKRVLKINRQLKKLKRKIKVNISQKLKTRRFHRQSNQYPHQIRSMGQIWELEH